MILRSGNDFIYYPAKKNKRPEGNSGVDFPFVKRDFKDHSWEKVNLPCDWAINQPFYTGDNPEVGGGLRIKYLF